MESLESQHVPLLPCVQALFTLFFFYFWTRLEESFHCYDTKRTKQ